jgi:ABC-2 type transport system ATP-binding protein
MIEARGLRRLFGSFVAVEDVSLSVPDGTIVALLGPNGAGKTTTVRMLAGLLAPTQGDADVAGCDVRTQARDVRARVGMVTDTPGLHDQMTPRDYLDFFGRLYGMPPARRRRRIDDLLSVFDLQAVAGKRMVSYSRGMQQKVALARALLHEPSVVFLDEPTAGLDPLAARMVRDLIVGLKNESRSIVLCTHDLDEAERLADVIAIMRRGRIVARGSARALRAAASQSCLVQVTLAHPSPEALTIVAAVDGVLDPKVDGPAIVSFRTDDATRTNPLVIASLVGHGMAIVSVTSMDASLEDVFRLAVAPEPAA